MHSPSQGSGTRTTTRVFNGSVGASHIHPPDPPLRGKSFVLRPWTKDDVYALLRIAATPDIPRWTYLPESMTEEQAEHWIQRAHEVARSGRGLPLAIEDTDTGSLLGNVGLAQVNQNLGTGELYWWLDGTARGRGIATTAVILLASWALDRLGLARVAALVEPANRPSSRLAQRAGFQREGVLRSVEPSNDGRGRIDLAVWSLLRGDR
jgi:RimJ/RimL family protein N-acetyltransferase